MRNFGHKKRYSDNNLNKKEASFDITADHTDQLNSMIDTGNLENSTKLGQTI